jgi:threonine aldolase
MKPIDLRSDTVTHPSPAMRKAMYDAEVGDDGFGDDPTVNQLQEIAAERLGKEAGLFVASGTMGNLVCTLTHCQRAQEVILGAQSHTVRHERGGIAALAGVFPRAIQNESDGTLNIDSIKASINPSGHMFAETRMICLENTWNGRVLQPEYVQAVHALAQQHNLKMHLDGARIFNAAVALNKPVHSLCREFDSVQFCFSKGLSAPIGSMVCGTKEFIKEARNNRHLVGGTMRQVGVIAAACIVALDQMVERLAEDHENARKLAHGLSEFSQIKIDPATVDTNIVFFKTCDPAFNAFELAQELRQEGVGVVPFSETELRAVTHYGVDSADIDEALSIFKRVFSSSKLTVTCES